MAFNFKKLRIWQQSLALSEKINKICRKFPKDEIFVLVSQMKRAADSVSLNIAEGSTGQSNSEFRKFLGYAIRSSVEVVGCLYLARSRAYISEGVFQDLYIFLDSLVKSIQALRNSLN